MKKTWTMEPSRVDEEDGRQRRAHHGREGDRTSCARRRATCVIIRSRADEDERQRREDQHPLQRAWRTDRAELASGRRCAGPAPQRRRRCRRRRWLSAERHQRRDSQADGHVVVDAQHEGAQAGIDLRPRSVPGRRPRTVLAAAPRFQSDMEASRLDMSPGAGHPAPRANMSLRRDFPQGSRPCERDQGIVKIP